MATTESAEASGSACARRLADRLGRPPASLATLERLGPEQAELLIDAIDRICERRERLLDERLGEALPAGAARLLLAILRRQR